MSNQFSESYTAIYDHIIAKLQKGLSPRLTYHCTEHTLEVLKQSLRIASDEKITDPEDLYLLQVAALYHDCGFIYLYSGHEARGCELAREELPGFGLTENQVEKICGMIMATKIPQSPHNKLEEIICDADLDYLGRDDFEPISNNLYREFLDYGFVKDYDDWMQKQISFFESHHYFTPSSQKIRHPEKMKLLAALKKYPSPGKK